MKSTSLKISNLVVNHVRNNYTVYVSPQSGYLDYAKQDEYFGQ